MIPELAANENAVIGVDVRLSTEHVGTLIVNGSYFITELIVVAYT